MITNETRAKLIGRKWMHLDVPCEGDGYAGCGLVPWNPEHDANAAADLRAFVRARGKYRWFMGTLWRVIAGFDGVHEFVRDLHPEEAFHLINATPQQQTAAFDRVFKDDLERINET